MGIRAGFFGKLPSRGDFVRCSLPRAVAAPWDQWLQSVLPAAQFRLGEGWPDVWHAAQAWRFAFAPGVCGPQPVTGVWLPSVDKVGRSFPLMIAVQAAAIDDAFLAVAERAGVDAIRRVVTPDMLADCLNRAMCPVSAASAASHPAVRWWQRTEGTGGAVLRGDALPDADTFVRMLAA